MSIYWRRLLVLLLCVRHETESSIAVRRFVYQKDMSEYCRRRVVPSVFLGRQVVDANSQILHFSKLELPYSCVISIRAQSGSNIILVIQLMSDKRLQDSCKESGSQLAVYEIGETFGGYWGPLPYNLMEPEPEPPESVNYYTLKTTEMPSTTVESSDEESGVESEKRHNNISKEIAPPAPWDMSGQADGDFITMELPIVNVSAKLVPGNIQSEPLFNIDDSFDIIYDVTPGVGMQYETTVMPLVQFSVDNVVDGNRRGGGGVQWSPRYGVDYDDIFTLDPRLNFLLDPTTSKIINTKKRSYNKYNYNRRLNFKRKKQLFAAKESLLRKKHPSTIRRAQYTIQPYNIFTRHYDFAQPPESEKNVEPVPNSWEVIEDILKNLSKTEDVATEGPTKNDSYLLHKISDMEHNISAYLAPYWSAFTNISTSSPIPVSRYSISPITWRLPSVSYGSNTLEQLDDTNKGEALLNDVTESPSSVSTVEHHTRSEQPVGIQGFSLDVDNIIINAVNVSMADVSSKRTTILVTDASSAATLQSSELLAGSLVDHESWDNVVQSASVMAVSLNQTAPQKNSTTGSANRSTTTASPINSNVRKKRHVYAIPIENARPHKLLATKKRFATTASTFKISDAQEFAELVELQDDELHGRVALRYLPQYVGPVLFNICDYDRTTARHVYLFNASRLVLAINNFTLDHMTVVMTPAHTLLSSEARCAGAHLECQVSGARVCINSLSACDGIPNCGSYDIYDEDRLTCGAAAGLRHNVCLAAFTFLAVLLTILYAVHYWLKRCVPRVSDAFFIYTDAAENVLYLDSIMRAPYDTDDGKPYYRSHILQEETQGRDVHQEAERKNLFKRFITKCFIFFRKRKMSVSREDIMMAEFYKMLPEAQRIYSFAEGEIDKIMPKHLTDAAMQTGSSLEIKVRNKASGYKFPTEIHHVNENPGTSKDTKSRDYGSRAESVSLEHPYDELSMLKFFRTERSVSSVNSVYKGSPPPKIVRHIAPERELQCLDLERSERSSLAPPVEEIRTTSEIHGEKAELARYVRKQLRFEEETTTIPSPAYEPAAERKEKDDNPHRRSIALGAGRTHWSQDLDAIEVCEEKAGSRDHKSYFWGGGKSKTKKGKKKTQVSLRGN